MLLGPPQISLEALVELRRLLSNLHSSACDKGSLTPTPKEKESVDEANAPAPGIAVPQEKQKELKVALIDLLTSAASVEGESPDRKTGGDDESEINR